MTAKYTKLPLADPDTALDFESTFDFESSKFMYTSAKYKSAFTYNEGPKPESFEFTDTDETPSCLSRYCSYCVLILVYLLTFITLPISGWFSFKTIQVHERLIIYRLGRLIGAKGPGIVFILPFIDKISKVDLRMRAFSVPPQKILTADNAALEIGADLYYRVKDPILSISGVQNLDNATRIFGQTCLLKQVSRHTLGGTEHNKSLVCQDIQDDINKMTLTWGVEVSKVELSQIKVISPPTKAEENPMDFLKPVLMSAGGSPQQSLGQAMTAIQQCMVPIPGLSPAPQEQAALEAPAGGVYSGRASGLQFRTPQDLVAAVQPHLSQHLIRQYGTVYQFVVNGPTPLTFYLDLKNGDGSIGEGPAPDGPADVTLTLTSEVMARLLADELGAFNAYMGGHLEVEGDLKAAMRLGDLVDLVRPGKPVSQY